jgi:uncharacterized protein (DUF697 family)
MDLSPFNIYKKIKELGMTRKEKADQVVKEYVLYAMGAGLVVVIPVLDIAAVTALQITMVRKLCEVYEVEYNENKSKAFITSTLGSITAGVGASVLKSIPIIGSALGGVSMAVLSGGATYAAGQVFARHFEGGGSLDNFDSGTARKLYEEEFERGKKVAQKWKDEYFSKEAKNETPSANPAANAGTAAPTEDVFAKLEKLNDLRVKGIITEDEFNAKKQVLLSAI